MAFWNVENLFDTRHDTLKEDYAFTPEGDNHWTPRRYADKLNKIYKTIAAMRWPVLVGLAEVENDHVLQDLCIGTPLRRKGYRYIHYESPDQRGMDCALMYRADLFHILESRNISVSDSSARFFSRDILMVGGLLNQTDSCFVLVNHWPSKLGGISADAHRMRIARQLLHTMDSLQIAHPTALILAVGDFNASSDEKFIRDGLGFEGEVRNSIGFYNLLHHVPRGEGSYKYHDNWLCIDQAFANRPLHAQIFAPDFLLIEDKKWMSRKPFRTYTGPRYQGGFSDHLPILICLP